MSPERVVIVRPRTVLMVAGILLAVAAGIWLVLVAERVLIWTLVSLFLAMALNPAVDWLQRHRLRSRGAATAVVYLAVTLVIGGLGALIIPTLVQQLGDLVDALPATSATSRTGAARSASWRRSTTSSSACRGRSRATTAAAARWRVARARRSTSRAASSRSSPASSRSRS